MALNIIPLVAEIKRIKETEIIHFFSKFIFSLGETLDWIRKGEKNISNQRKFYILSF